MITAATTEAMIWIKTATIMVGSIAIALGVVLAIYLIIGLIRGKYD